MSKKHKKTCRTLDYLEHSLLFIPVVTGCVSISVLAYLDGIPIGITSSRVGLKICAVTTGIKKYKSIIKKKKKKKYDNIVLLGKTKLDAMEVLISKALINSYSSQDEFVSVNNVLRGYNERREEIKKS